MNPSPINPSAIMSTSPSTSPSSLEFHSSLSLQEIENIFLRFQYATKESMPAIQAEINGIFKLDEINTKWDLFQQIKLCLWLLSSSKREIVHSLVQSHLKNLLTLKHGLFAPKELMDLRNALVQCFDVQNSNRFILNSFIQIQAIISVLGWLDMEEFAERYNEMRSSAESPNPSPFALPSILSLVQEMNPDVSAIKNFGKHRKTAMNFRDNTLKAILQAAFYHFVQTVHMPQESTEMALAVISSCLSFDFLGTMADQDSHGMTSAVQIPSSLKSWIIEEKPLDHLLEAFESFPPQKHDKILEALSWIMGCRRSLFLEEERIAFFDRACMTVTRLVSFSFDEEATQEWLKLLLRFSSVYCNDFKKGEKSRPMFEALLLYTKAILPQASSTTFLFLVQIWAQLRESEHVFFVECLEAFKEMLLLFINVSPEMLEIIYFDDENSSEQIVSPLGKLLRACSTEFTMQVVVNRLAMYGQDLDGLAMIQTAWTISIYTHSICHRIAYQAEASDDKADGETCAQIFNYSAQKPILSEPSNKCDEQLELSLLSFFEQFKHTFLTGDGSSCPECWKALASISQITTQEHVLGIFLQRSMQYLKDHISEALVLRSVQLFKELVSGVRTLKLLQTPELTNYIESSGILGFHIQTTFQKSKCLTVLFENLGRLFMNDVYQNVPEQNLMKLLEPISFYLDGFERNGNDGSQIDLIVRKLRGILGSIYSSKLFKIFFDWIQPHLPAFSVFLNSPAAVNGPVNTLKLVRDLVLNKVNRLVFDTAHEYPILVFREAMSIILPIVMRLEAMLTSQSLSETVWVQQCLKPIIVLMDTFKNAINSRAVPFGILRLYGDGCLKEMIQSVFVLSSFIRPEQLLQYSKLGTTFFNLWVCMTSDYMPYLTSTIDEGLFGQLVLNSYRILEKLDNSTSSQACTFIASVYTEMNSTKRLFTVSPGQFHKAAIPLLLNRILNSSNLETQWSFTRPLLPLILYDIDWFQAYIGHLARSQPGPSEQLEKILFGILNGIEDQTLSSKNRDRFTSNLESIKRNLKSENLVTEFGELSFTF